MNLQLSAMDWGVEGMDAPELHHVDYQGCRPDRITERAASRYADRFDRRSVEEETPGSLVSFERGSLAVRARWDYEDPGDLVTSPTFVPRSGGGAASRPGGADGYVVQPVLSDDGFRVEVFDAADVGAGPTATLRAVARECVPLLLHSAWMPPARGLVDAPRIRFAEEVTDARLAGLDGEQRAAVATVAAELSAR